MSNSICVPQASRRRSKWYVRLKRRKHLFVWIALSAAVLIVLGYGTVRALKQNAKEDEVVIGTDKPIVSPKFKGKL